MPTVRTVPTVPTVPTVLTVPTGRASNGVPTSIQIVGRTYTDKDVFQAGMAYESVAPGWFAQNGVRPDIPGG